MKKAGMVLGLAMVVAACNGQEAELDAPEEAPIAGGEDADIEESSEEGSDEAEAKEEAEAETAAIEKPSATKQASANPKTIPAQFRGKWGAPGWDCVSYDDSYFEVRAAGITYPESGGEFTSVRMDGNDAIVELKVQEPGDGPLLDMTHRLTLYDGQLYVLEPSNRYSAGDEGLDRCD